MKLLQRLFTDVPFIESGAFSALVATDVQLAEHAIFKRLRESLKPQMELRQDGIAIVPVEGPLAYKPDPFEMLVYGVEDSRNVLEMVGGAARNADVTGILLNIDSPGGMMVGGFEIADAVRAADKAKPVVAWTGGWATSLAYLIGSQASQVISTRTAQVGSIGTILSIADYSKLFEARGIKVEVFTNKEGTLKGTGTIGTSLSEEQREHLQARVNQAHAEFKKQVLAARPGIPDEAMKGQSLFGSEGKKLGLVDRIGDMNFALSVLKARIRAGRDK
jgi:signal peptide peptidase SppA